MKMCVTELAGGNHDVELFLNKNSLADFVFSIERNPNNSGVMTVWLRLPSNHPFLKIEEARRSPVNEGKVIGQISGLLPANASPNRPRNWPSNDYSDDPHGYR